MHFRMSWPQSRRWHWVTAQPPPLEENATTMSHEFSTLILCSRLCCNTRIKQRRSLHKDAHADTQSSIYTRNKQTDWFLCLFRTQQMFLQIRGIIFNKELNKRNHHLCIRFLFPVNLFQWKKKLCFSHHLLKIPTAAYKAFTNAP